MKTFQIQKFGWINQADNPTDLDSFEATNLRNVRLTKESISTRKWTKSIWDIWSWRVEKILEVENTLFAFQNWELKRYNSELENTETWELWVWESTWLSGISSFAKPKIIKFDSIWSSPIYSWTITDVWSLNITLFDESWTYWENVLFGKLIKVWDKIRKISANTEKEIIVADAFLESPIWEAYEIYEPVDSSFFFSWTNQVKKTYDISSVNEENKWFSVLWVPFFKYVIEYQNRLVWALEWSYTIYISTILNWECFPYTLEVGKWDWDIITGLVKFGNQLVIFKKFSIWIAEFVNPTDAILVQRADNFWCIEAESIAIWENILFFVSHRWIEWFNRLETNALEWHKCLSDFRLPWLGNLDQKNAQISSYCFDGKYFCNIVWSWLNIWSDLNNSWFNSSLTVIFDISLYLQRAWEYSKNKNYVFLIDEWYEAISWTSVSGKLFSSWTGKVLEHWIDSKNEDWTIDWISRDWETPVSAFWHSKKIDLQTPVREKVLRKILLNASGLENSWEIFWKNFLNISIKTDKEEKNLEEKNFLDFSGNLRDAIEVKGKRTKWRNFIIKINFYGFKRASLENLECIFEVGKI